MQALSEDREKEKVGSSAWKAATKEKFTRFYDLLEEVGERHRVARVLEEEEEGKKAIAEEAVKLVVPSLQRFIQKQRDKEFSKSEPCLFFMMMQCVYADVPSTSRQTHKSVSMGTGGFADADMCNVFQISNCRRKKWRLKYVLSTSNFLDYIHGACYLQLQRNSASVG